MSANGEGGLPEVLGKALQPIVFKRSFYPNAGVKYGTAKELVPGIDIEGGDGEPMVLMFELPNQEQHVFLLDANGKRGLLGQLTGGVEIARTLPAKPEADG